MQVYGAMDEDEMDAIMSAMNKFERENPPEDVRPGR